MQIKISPFIPITLGMLTAFGPFVTDVYLPAMPELADYYRTSAVAVGASLTAGMLGLASGQILIGPLSDKFGRKKLLLLSMALFVIASLLCVFRLTSSCSICFASSKACPERVGWCSRAA